MANIQIKRGQKTQVDVEYKLAGQSSGANLGTSAYDAELVIRRKRGSLYDGQLIDTLRFGASSPADSDKDSRITLVHGPSQSPATTDNIQLIWSTAQAAALPNEEITVAGDLKILTSGGEVIYSINLVFDIIPEII